MAFKLTDKDKELLRKWGYPESDLLQIEDAANEGKIKSYRKETASWNHISVDGAIRILGRTEFLSGLSRAAFHRSAQRENNGRRVSFDLGVWW